MKKVTNETWCSWQSWEQFPKVGWVQALWKWNHCYSYSVCSVNNPAHDEWKCYKGPADAFRDTTSVSDNVFIDRTKPDCARGQVGGDRQSLSFHPAGGNQNCGKRLNNLRGREMRKDWRIYSYFGQLCTADKTREQGLSGTCLSWCREALMSQDLDLVDPMTTGLWLILDKGLQEVRTR